MALRASTGGRLARGSQGKKDRVWATLSLSRGHAPRPRVNRPDSGAVPALPPPCFQGVAGHWKLITFVKVSPLPSGRIESWGRGGAVRNPRPSKGLVWATLMGRGGWLSLPETPDPPSSPPPLARLPGSTRRHLLYLGQGVAPCFWHTSSWGRWGGGTVTVGSLGA